MDFLDYYGDYYFERIIEQNFKHILILMESNNLNKALSLGQKTAEYLNINRN